MWGSSPHFDNCLMTILKQDKADGLEIEYKGDWYPVKPMEDCIVVNIGTLMEHLSDGNAKAVYHRVKNTDDRLRCAWPVFLAPNLNRDMTQMIDLKRRVKLKINTAKALRFHKRGWYKFNTFEKSETAIFAKIIV
ncbi:Oidioi.mRNA.OKI2018_I69.PAR.g12829.t1.cds [Oikopleura dioica]|uniref:Oidioi.mRNA.OKI2018_I69.PAR.g12829.t1.cds n=1 Tax=Oikopleura dioica TaxID=34765 RepID=A0ABN7S6L9_OIKDI|nr:Oidioi.mRNA.OKI2018_I69.PAR.g12829.t1.cds [Oikopleura dioica]